MDRIIVTGGKPLFGEIEIQGSKNAALPMMAAALLHKGRSVLHRCPRIADVRIMEEILQDMGVKIERWKDTVILDASHVEKTEIDVCAGQKMRSSVVLLGSILGRFKEAAVPHPGGCVIGARPIDLHVYALEKLGAHVEEKDGMLTAEAKKLTGARISFSKRSVGATQNALLASVLAEGITVLENCAVEPEIIWLCRFLNAGGAKIMGTGKDILIVEGVKELHDTEFTVPADRIVAGTYVLACAASRGEIILKDAPMEEMHALLSAYEKIGGQYEVKSGKLILYGANANCPLAYQETQVYPGFPTDLQSPLMAVLAGIPGKSCLSETIFEDRFKTAEALGKMGADIRVDGNRAEIYGKPLHGAVVEASELRGGAALVLAGIAAQGRTCIENRHFIERGYEDICRDLKSLGAEIAID